MEKGKKTPLEITGMAISRILSHGTILVFCMACVIPLLLVASVSLSDNEWLKGNGYSLIPQKFSFAAYDFIFKAQSSQVLLSYLVTISVTLIGTVVGIWLTTTLAYVMSRKDFAPSNAISFYVFFTMLISGGLVPSYILIVNYLHLKNTLAVLIVPYLVGAWNVLLMKGFLRDIPMAVIESAKIDGAGEFTIFTRIIVPMGKAGIATVSLFIALAYWNDWFLSMLYMDNSKIISLQYRLVRIMENARFMTTGANAQFMKVKYDELPTLTMRMAMCVLAAGPMLLVFPFFQKYFVKGLTVGSVKG